MLIDTHIHLDAAEFDGDRDGVIEEARRQGVARFIVPAVALANFKQVETLLDTLPGSACAFGIHPLYVQHAEEAHIEQLRDWLKKGRAVAVGEIGLDAYEPDADMARQEWFFAEQLKLARAFDLPVLLHVRRAQDRILGLLRRFPVKGGIAHAFNGSFQQAQAFIDRGFKLGFGGAMTYAGSTRIRALATQLPLESIVLESDAPDIPPAWAARERNVPANVRRFAQILAELRQIDLSEVAAVTTQNAEFICKF